MVTDKAQTQNAETPHRKAEAVREMYLLDDGLGEGASDVLCPVAQCIQGCRLESAEGLQAAPTSRAPRHSILSSRIWQLCRTA